MKIKNKNFEFTWEDLTHPASYFLTHFIGSHDRSSLNALKSEIPEKYKHLFDRILKLLEKDDALEIDNDKIFLNPKKFEKSLMRCSQIDFPSRNEFISKTAIKNITKEDDDSSIHQYKIPDNKKNSALIREAISNFENLLRELENSNLEHSDQKSHYVTLISTKISLTDL